MSKRTSWRPINRQKWDVWDLEEARYQFWLGDYVKAGRLIFPLVERLVVEPMADTQEYKDGQGKPPESVDEPEEAKSDAFEDWTIPAFLETGDDERDEDGYLIR